MGAESGFVVRKPATWRDPVSAARTLGILKDALSIAPMAALCGVWWFVRGKRQRSWNKLIAAAASHPNHYRRFLSAQNAALARRTAIVSKEQTGRLIAVIVLQPGSTTADVAATQTSLLRAFGSEFIVHSCAGGNGALIAHDADEPISRTIAALSKAHPSAWAMVMQAGDTIDQHAASILRRGMVKAGGASLVYWDEDVVRFGVHGDPWLKPQWDELIHFARDCLTGACALRLAAALPVTTNLGNASELQSWTELLSNLAALSDVAPVHLPVVLTHRASELPALARELRAGQLSAAWGEFIALSDMPGKKSWSLVEFQSPHEWPGVSIIIPSKDQAKLLHACLRSLDKLAYLGPMEIIIVDNGSSQVDALELLSGLEANAKATVIRAPGPFNFSALVNLAAKSAKHPFLCLLNNDVEATCGDWLAKMVVHALRPRVGAVGAQLLYSDGTIQHAGVVVGIGGAAGHFAKGADPNGTEHRAWFGITRHISAVTAACLVVRRDRYTAVGGLDEKDLRVAFNDVDLCLKLRQAGLRNVYVAEARLIHHESKSRGLDLSSEKARRFALEEATLKSRWGTDQFEDPCFNPQFTSRLETIAFASLSDADRG